MALHAQWNFISIIYRKHRNCLQMKACVQDKTIQACKDSGYKTPEYCWLIICIQQTIPSLKKSGVWMRTIAKAPPEQWAAVLETLTFPLHFNFGQLKDDNNHQSNAKENI